MISVGIRALNKIIFASEIVNITSEQENILENNINEMVSLQTLPEELQSLTPIQLINIINRYALLKNPEIRELAEQMKESQ